MFPSHDHGHGEHEPGFVLELTCLSCGRVQRVNVRSEWACPADAAHVRVRVRALPTAR